MKALVKDKPAVGLWMQDRPVPEIGRSRGPQWVESRRSRIGGKRTLRARAGT